MSLPFSANLGFLWNDLPLPEAVQRAAGAGFGAVELHWPYAVDPARLGRALADTGLPVLSLNTMRGNAQAGEFGLSALPGREDEARAAIDEALAYAAAINAPAIHVMAGVIRAGETAGQDARETFVANLRYAADRGAASGINILIEPLNLHDVPGYFLHDNATASAIIDETGRENIRIMFDCYHVGRAGKPILEEFELHRPRIGHVQFAAVPDRGEPDAGSVDFARLLPEIVARGYAGYFGAEYRPRRSTDEGLGWLAAWR